MLLSHDAQLTLKNLFLPTFCKRCQRRLLTEENGFYCPTCWELSRRIMRPFCSRCGQPFDSMRGYGSVANFACNTCKVTPVTALNRIYGAAYYEECVAEAIKLLKFGRRQKLAEPLGELMGEYIGREMDAAAYDLVVPVPLHKVRERDRGFNQSFLLAAQIVALFPNATLDDRLHRIRPTRTQSRLAPEERRANLRGAFAVIGEGCPGARVLLIDDVVTTSGTALECAKALRRAGAAQVDVLAAALAVDPFRT